MRVIAGEWSGRRLQAPRGRGTRPTSDRVREALVMALEPVAGLVVVDLFAGSGALGIETLSRGASVVHFVEHDRGALESLEANLEALGARDRAVIWRQALPAAVSRLAEVLSRADLVLADPPYGGGDARAVLEALGQPGRLRAGSRMVVEHHAKDALPERAGRLERTRERRYGETSVTWYLALGGEPGAQPGGA